MSAYSTSVFRVLFLFGQNSYNPISDFFFRCSAHFVDFFIFIASGSSRILRERFPAQTSLYRVLVQTISLPGKSLFFAGVANAGIYRPLFRTHLSNDPPDKRCTRFNAMGLVAPAPICFVCGITTLRTVARNAAPAACSGRRATFQLIGNGGG